MFNICLKVRYNVAILIYVYENILYQRWNNFIINYSGGTLDIFINNNLVVSKQNIIPIQHTDIQTMVIGTKNGIHGGLKELVYYDKVLSKNEIYAIYNSYF